MKKLTLCLITVFSLSTFAGGDTKYVRVCWDSNVQIAVKTVAPGAWDLLGLLGWVGPCIEIYRIKENGEPKRVDRERLHQVRHSLYFKTKVEFQGKEYGMFLKSDSYRFYVNSIYSSYEGRPRGAALLWDENQQEGVELNCEEGYNPLNKPNKL